MIALGERADHQHQAGARRRIRRVEGDSRSLPAQRDSRVVRRHARERHRSRAQRGARVAAELHAAGRSLAELALLGARHRDARSGRWTPTAWCTCRSIDRASASTVDMDRVDNLTVRREELGAALAPAMTTDDSIRASRRCSPGAVGRAAASRCVARFTRIPSCRSRRRRRPTDSSRRCASSESPTFTRVGKTGVVARVPGRRSRRAGRRDSRRHRRAADSGGDRAAVRVDRSGRDARLRTRRARDVGRRRRGAARRVAGRGRRARRASAGRGDREGRARDSRERRARRTSRRSSAATSIALRGRAGRRRRRSARRVGRHVRDRARSAPARTRRGRTSRAIRSSRAAAVISALQTIVARRLNPATPGVVTIGTIHAGSAPNVIPDRAKLSGTVRAVEPVSRRLMLDEVQRVAESVASGYGVEARVTLDRRHTADRQSAGADRDGPAGCRVDRGRGDTSFRSGS